MANFYLPQKTLNLTEIDSAVSEAILAKVYVDYEGHQVKVTAHTSENLNFWVRCIQKSN